MIVLYVHFFVAFWHLNRALVLDLAFHTLFITAVLFSVTAVRGESFASLVQHCILNIHVNGFRVAASCSVTGQTSCAVPVLNCPGTI